jgi:uncharacterized protein
MTPQERELVTALFDRLAALENSPRDPEAERLIAHGSALAPHALYPLVQTVVLQDEALKRASARIEELEGNAGEQRGGSFLDAVRGTVLGQAPAGARGEARGSVPSVRPGGVWNTGQASSGAAPTSIPSPTIPGPVAGTGGSFLGTAAAAAVGMIGGSLLFNSIRGLMGGGQPAAFGGNDLAAQPNSPWGSDASGSDLARSAGVEDVGTSSPVADSSRTAGLFDQHPDDSADDLRDDDFANGDFGDTGGTSDA